MVNAGFLAILRLVNGWYFGVCSTGIDQKPRGRTDRMMPSCV